MLVSGYWQAWKMLHMEKEVECVPDWVKNISPKPNEATDFRIPKNFSTPMKFNVGTSGKVMIKLSCTSRVLGFDALESWVAEVDGSPVTIHKGEETWLPEDFGGSASAWGYSMNMCGIIFFEGAAGEHELIAYTDAFSAGSSDFGIAMRVVEINSIPEIIDIKTRYTLNKYGGQSFTWHHPFNMQKGDLLLFMGAGTSHLASPIEFITPSPAVYGWRDSLHNIKINGTEYQKCCVSYAHSEVLDDMEVGLTYGVTPSIRFPLINNLTTPTRITIAQVRGLTYTD